MQDRIEIVNIPDNCPAHYLDTRGFLTFDLVPGFSFQLTERLEELTDINQIQGTAVLGIELPFSAKNDWVLQNFLSPNVLDNTFEPLTVRLVTAGGSVLPQNQLWVLGIEDANAIFRVEIVRGDDFWGRKAENIALNSLDYGSITLSTANMLSNFTNYQYTDGGAAFWFPIIHRRAFALNPDTFVTEDLLPFVSLPYILKKGFQAAGWGLSSPLLTSDWFTRLWGLFIAPEVSYTNQGKKYVVKAKDSREVTAPFIFGDMDALHFVWDTIETDEAGNLEDVVRPEGDATAYISKQKVGANVNFCIGATFINEEASHSAEISIGFYDTQAGENITAYVFTLNGGQTLDVYFCEEIFVHPGREIVMFWETISSAKPGTGPGADPAAPHAITFKNAYLNCSVATKRLFADDVLSIAEVISPDISFLDFLKGVAHLCDLKFRTDWNTRTVEIYPPAENDIFGENVEGFLLPYAEAVDITDKIAQGSRVVSFPRERTNRYLRLQFKKGNDKRVEELKLPETSPLYSRSVDLGEALKNETTVSENPLFEPTANVTHLGMSLPAVWGDSDGETASTRIGPRVLFGVGYDLAQVDPISNKPILWYFNELPQYQIPYAAQLPEAILLEDITGRIYMEPGNVVYGTKTKDLYTTFYRFLADHFRLSPTYEFLALIDQALFDKLNFRRRVYIRYGGEAFFSQLLEKRDFRTNEDITTPIVLRPDFQKRYEVVEPADSAAYNVEAYINTAEDVLLDMTTYASSLRNLNFSNVASDDGGNLGTITDIYGNTVTVYQPAAAAEVSVEFALQFGFFNGLDNTELRISIVDFESGAVLTNATFYATPSEINVATITETVTVSNSKKLGWRILMIDGTDITITAGTSFIATKM